MFNLIFYVIHEIKISERDAGMKYQYSELSPAQFETLVIHVCYRLLGLGTETFSDGPDGGRDSRFHGEAELFPSRSKPWSGLTVIQAKHTLAYNKKFSDPDFFGVASSAVNGEILKIKRLIDNDGLNNYLLFSNRKLPGNANEAIKSFISFETGLDKQNIGLVGIESFENYLKFYPDVPAAVGLNPFEMPLNIEPDDLASIIVGLSNGLGGITKRDISTRIFRTDFERKNEINSLSDQYSKLIKRKIEDMYLIQDFLAMPENDDLQRLYLGVSEELAAKIIALRIPGQSFDIVLEKLIELLLDRDIELKGNKQLTRSMMYYMYYHCDIGDDDVANA